MFKTIILMRKRSKLEKELNDRDLKNFKDITMYIGMSSLPPIEQEIIFQQILDIMLQAKSEGKFASEVIGEDIKGFCDSIIEESNYSKCIFNKCFNYIEIVLQTGFVYLLMMFIASLITHGWNISLEKQDVFYIDIVWFGAIFIIMGPLSSLIKRKKIFRKKNSKLNYYWLLWIICVYLILSLEDMIKTKLPQLTTAHIMPYENKIYLLIAFFIAFGRDIWYLIKSISRKFS